jgi:hypothetical protein
MLFEIVYHSQAKTQLSAIDILDILKHSRDSNAKKGITGCLLHHKKQFLQILEGEELEVKQLYEKIRKDSRHQNVITLHAEKITERIFDKWNMAFQDFKDETEVENTIGISDLNQVLKQDESGNISKEIFKTMSTAILTSN